MTREADFIERAGESDVLQANPRVDQERDARNRAVDTLAAVYRRVQRDVASNGWLMIGEPLVRGADNDIMRFAMLRDGVIVSECGFSIGPGRTVAFGRPAQGAIASPLDDIGEEEFHHLMQTWASDVQAGVG